jgi:exopolyphosphatase/pppGpp-phosphohydrolase
MGSHLITLSGSSPEPEDGPSFRDRVERLRTKLAERLKAFPWQKIKKGAAKGASVVVMMAGIAGAANAMHVDLKKMQVPTASVEYVIAGGSFISIARECKKMMEKKEEPAK